jgi:nicotinamide phosphoribosyltransferase
MIGKTMTDFNLMYAADFYKVSHKAQYPANVTKVHSVLVARGANYNDNISKEEFQWFGYSLFIDKLQTWAEDFFNLDGRQVDDDLVVYKKFLDTRLGGDNDVSHWKDLWVLNELPITICAVPEKTIAEFQTPLLTIENTDDRFAWLPAFIETSMLSNIWGVTTAANRAWHIRKSIEAKMVGYSEEELAAIDFMGHDFSYRGLMGDEAAAMVGCGHLANFKGSDTIPAIRKMEQVYGEITGFSVPATEHSVMCAGGQATEEETYSRILDIYPSGIVSIVSDTWDYFKVLTETLPSIKDRIMAREGKVVIRPDSGDPVEIICGAEIKDYSGYDFASALLVIKDIARDNALDNTDHGEHGVDSEIVLFSWHGYYFKAEVNFEWNRFDKQYYFLDEASVVSHGKVTLTDAEMGSLRILDEVFGHTLDSAGLKVLDSHIGLIYGDGMNQERIITMLDTMVERGYSPLNLVFGIGAYTYQLTTRDELGFAFKATAVEIDGEWVNIQKDPKTDQSKKSLTGRFVGGDLKKVF